jgi:Na+-transporting methylmalonyl-CoA/oxaloacetate decarboxylase beta subunit
VFWNLNGSSRYVCHGGVLIYLAIKKDYDTYAFAAIGFGAIW